MDKDDFKKLQVSLRQEGVLNLVLKELARAEEIHPHWPEDKIHAVAIITEEVGEAMQAAIDYEYGKVDGYTDKQRLEMMKEELVQTAAMALRALFHLEEKGVSCDG